MMRTMGFLLTGLLPLMAMWPACGLTIMGRVVDSKDDAVADASVWVSQERRVQRTATGPDGTYRFDALRVGGIELTAFKEGYAIGGRTAFAVGDTEVRLVLAEPGSTSIRILDHRGDPIPGARVKTLAVSGQAMAQFLAPVDALAAHGFPTLRSNDAGVIEIPFIPVNGYAQVVIQHTDYIESPPVYLPIREKQTDTVLREGLRLRGRVLYDDHPMPETRVSIYQNGPDGQKKVSETVTDGDGLFRFVAPSGVYFIALRHPDYASPKPVQVVLSDDTEHTVHLLSLRTPCVISGRVLLPDGQGCGGVRVVYREGDVVYEDIFTDVEGNYVIKAPGDSEGFLRIFAPPGYMTELEGELPLKIGEQSFVHVQDLPLLSLPSIRGTVLEDGKPAARVLVATANLTNPSMAITDEEGRFSFALSEVPEGNIVVARAEHALRFLRKSFAVNLEQPTPVELTLEPFTPDQEQEPEPNYRNSLKALLNEPAPAIECERWFNSEPVQISDLRGNVVVLTLWAGFDRTPLGLNRIQEMRALQALYAEDDNVVVIGVHDGSSLPAEVEDYVRAYGITFPVGQDKEPASAADSWTFDNYGVNAVPQTVLIDKQGIVRYYQIEGRLLELIKVLRRRN